MGIHENDIFFTRGTEGSVLNSQHRECSVHPAIAPLPTAPEGEFLHFRVWPLMNITNAIIHLWCHYWCNFVV